MIIRDKQDLRKCVKQCVRRAEVIETCAQPGVIRGAYGAAAYLGEWASGDSLQEAFEKFSAGSPLAKKPAELIAALDALQLPAHDLDKAESIIKGYDLEAYLSAVLSAMRARRVLVQVPSDSPDLSVLADERFSPMLVAQDALFAPGRYGVNYESAAKSIAELMQGLRAKDVMLEHFAPSALRYCLFPVCEDEHTVLHVHAQSPEDVHTLFELLAEHPGVRAIVSAGRHAEGELLQCAASKSNVLVRLSDMASMASALRLLGTRFIPYASCASTPEGMIGGWVYAREKIWQTLYEAYLLLARAGFELTRERIEQDIDMLLCGNYEKLHEEWTE